MAKVVNGMSVPQLMRKTNYDDWCLQMKALLRSQDVWDMVEEGYVELDADEDQTVAQIATLKKHQRKPERYWRLRIKVKTALNKGEFEQLKMEPKEHITEYITRVEKVANQLGKNGEQMPSSRVISKVLCLPSNKGEGVGMIRLNPTIKHYRYNLTRINLGLLRAEILAVEEEEAEDKDEVDMVEVMKRERVSSIGMTEDKEKNEEISQKWNVLSVASMATMDMNVDYGSATIVKKSERNFLTEKEEDEEDMGILLTSKILKSKGETNLVTEDGKECGVLLMAKSSDAMDMESPIPTMDEVISIKDATIMEKENLEKELKEKDEEIQRIGRLIDEANEIMNKQKIELEELKKTTLEKEDKISSVLEPEEEEDEDVEKNAMKISVKIVEKSPKIKDEFVKVIEKSGITKLVKALKRSTKVKDKKVKRKKKKSNVIKRSKPGEGDRVVTKKEAVDFARECGCLFIECSAKTRVNIQQCFEELVLKVCSKVFLDEVIFAAVTMTHTIVGQGRSRGFVTNAREGRLLGLSLPDIVYEGIDEEFDVILMYAVLCIFL
ncbi:hypothetical protein V8G54_007693 [Vigna mungo]|uniref:DUF4219 domain-containing protein n=1 Tax=Vigna mungo TaxID=3915 RepID=A0AAQ3S968_VIGMU